MDETEKLIREAIGSLPLGQSTERTRKFLDAALHAYEDSKRPIPQPACKACHCGHCSMNKMLKEFGW